MTYAAVGVFLCFKTTLTRPELLAHIHIYIHKHIYPVFHPGQKDPLLLHLGALVCEVHLRGSG